MKIDNFSGLPDAVTGQVSTNKRIQGWEQEFLAQQRRSLSDNENSPKSDLGYRHPSGGEKSWQKIATEFTSSRTTHTVESGLDVQAPGSAQGMMPSQKVAAGYSRVTAQIPVAAKGGEQFDSTLRPDTKRAPMKAGLDLETQLDKLKGHLVIEEDGLVSVWVGRKLSDAEKAGLVSSIKTILVRNGLTLEKLTINGIEEQL